MNKMARCVLLIAVSVWSLQASAQLLRPRAGFLCPQGMVEGVNHIGSPKCIGIPTNQYSPGQVVHPPSAPLNARESAAATPAAQAAQAPAAAGWSMPPTANPAPVAISKPDPFSFPSKTDASITNVYFHDFMLTGLAPMAYFKLSATAIGKVGIDKPLSAGTNDIPHGSWNDDQEVMSSGNGTIAVRLRVLSGSSMGEVASIGFTLKDLSSSQVLATNTWSVTTSKEGHPGYYGDPEGPSGMVGGTPWSP
jgi:hypothetical protein